MDRNIYFFSNKRASIGQARKSLWIETCFRLRISSAFLVRLVRACGSKLYRNITSNNVSLVRLVRACGSKLSANNIVIQGDDGQARKSLWIETLKLLCVVCLSGVRLVRACGSKLDEQVSINANDSVRLVRACGSKRQIAIARCT